MEEEAKRAYIKQRLKNDPLSVDLQWSLMVSALSSYRHDSVLRPFPPMFLKEQIHDQSGAHDYQALEKAVDAVPYIGVLLESDDCKVRMPSEVVDLVYWLLKDKPFQMKFCDKDIFSEIKNLTGQTVSVPDPQYTFEVSYDSPSCAKFEALRNGRDLMYAYHGSRLENFHSILHFGLQGHLSKNAVFGEGTYLSADLSVCFPYAPSGKGWDKSLLGSTLSCIAVCEIIDDPSVKCQVKDSPTSQPSASSQNRSSVPGSIGGEVPEKYYVVRNNEVIRIKYLLVYAQKEKRQITFKESAVQWLLHHKITVMLVTYAVILIAVSLFNSKLFHYYLRSFFKR